jgi:hypothetical protein
MGHLSTITIHLRIAPFVHKVSTVELLVGIACLVPVESFYQIILYLKTVMTTCLIVHFVLVDNFLDPVQKHVKLAQLVLSAQTITRVGSAHVKFVVLVNGALVVLRNVHHAKKENSYLMMVKINMFMILN